MFVNRNGKRIARIFKFGMTSLVSTIVDHFLFIMLSQLTIAFMANIVSQLAGMLTNFFLIIAGLALYFLPAIIG